MFQIIKEVSFGIKNDALLEGAIILANLENWEDKPTFTLPVNYQLTTHEINFSDFTVINQKLNMDEIRSVVFSVLPKSGKEIPFNIDSSELTLMLPKNQR